MIMVQPKPSGLVKPTVDTRYHIDYTWWQKSDEDLRTYLLSHLAQEERERLQHSASDTLIDYVDPNTGEVSQVDEIHFALQEAASKPDYITQHTSLVDAIFRLLIANNNHPLSSNDLSRHLKKPASVILKMLSGNRVYKGIRPTEIAS
jgi:excinuclease UvrABC helicase subunit UvrB